jgi:P27 family predicted phage terminase small subunit
MYPYPKEMPEEHRKYWLEIVNCKPAGYYDAGDITLLKMYCRSAFEVDQLSVDLAKEGTVIRNARGNPVLNPKVMVRSFCETRLMTLATKLRVQPSSRASAEGDVDRRKKGQKAAEGARMVMEEMSGDGLLAGGGDRLQ